MDTDAQSGDYAINSNALAAWGFLFSTIYVPLFRCSLHKSAAAEELKVGISNISFILLSTFSSTPLKVSTRTFNSLQSSEFHARRLFLYGLAARSILQNIYIIILLI